MHLFNFYQVSILLFQGLLVIALILFLFRIRRTLGIGILFAALGLFQFMQVFLSSTVYIEVYENIIVSPGSLVLFTASLFAILLIYIKEDASETRKLIYALIATNIIMSILLQTFGWNVEDSSIYNPYNVSTELFVSNAWILFVGTITLFLDSILIIIIYELISKIISALFLRISLTMILIVSFDTVCFSLGAFWNSENLQTILISGLLAKGSFSIFYSLLLVIYLKFIDKDFHNVYEHSFKDIFYFLSYKQKFEIIKKEAEEAIQLSEIKYQTLTNISPVGVFLTRADGYTIYVNPKWCEISGLKAEDALGNGWLKALHPEDQLKIEQGWDNATEQNVSSFAEYRFLHPDGSIKWVLGQAVPEYNNENEIIGYVGTITDITEIKLFEIELNKTKEKAEESDRLKSAFLANMSHEIRTPMNGILGFSELLKEPKLTGEKQKEYIDIIESSSKRMLNLINDIVDISKIESGQIEVFYSSSKLKDLFDDLYNFFKPQTDKKEIELFYRIDQTSKNLIIKTDKIKTIGILTNLIRNAIKYTNAGSIEFGCAMKTQNNLPILEFFVKDTGNGIPKDRQDAIFDRFVQADIADREAMQGAGLGLSISKAYVEMLGGKIWVESKERIGSIFFFTLPYSIQAKENIQEPELKQEFERINSSQNLKILVVEDDEMSALLIKSIIKNISIDVLRAKNGIDAISLCEENPDIDLVLMDIKMPKMDGYTAAKKIKDFNPNLRIIAQSAYALQHEKIKYGDIFDDYITKPIDKEKLIDAIFYQFQKNEK